MEMDFDVKALKYKVEIVTKNVSHLFLYFLTKNQKVTFLFVPPIKCICL